jgi:hypothetical protein
MKMRQLITLIVALTLTSCTKGVFVEIHNDTGQSVTVRAYGKAATLKPKQKMRVRPYGSTGELVVEFDERKTTYALPSPVSEEWLIENSYRAVFALALQQDGSLALCQKESDGRVIPRAPQPIGFPLHPTRQN